MVTATADHGAEVPLSRKSCRLEMVEDVAVNVDDRDVMMHLRQIRNSLTSRHPGSSITEG